MKINKLFEYSNLFVFMGLIFGFQIIFVNPPWQTNDEDRHFYNAYALSEGVIGPKIKGNEIGQYLPAQLVESVNSFQGIGFSDQVKIKRSVLDDFKSVEIDARQKTFCKNATSTILPAAYLPAVVGIWIANLLHKSPIEIGWYARAGSLLAYLLIVFFAIRILPFFKPLLTVVALSPMALYQAASVSYDGMSFALLFLYFALVVKYCFDQEPFQLKHILTLVIVAFLQRMCKDGYTILYLTALIIPWAKADYKSFNSKKNYGLLIAGLLMAAFLPSFLWGQYLQALHIPPAALNSFQKDFIFNGSLNLKYHLAHPVHAFLLGMENSMVQGKEWLISAVGRFGYSYTKLPAGIALLDWIIFAAACVFTPPVLSKKLMLTFFCIGILNAMMIVYGFLIVGSPVGANSIFGLQGRYFTPIIPFVFAGAFQVRLANVNPEVLKWSLVLSSGVLLMFTISFLDKVFYF